MEVVFGGLRLGQTLIGTPAQVLSGISELMELRSDQSLSTSSSTDFNTSGSDSRLKKNFETWDEEVLPYFKSLQPKKFNFTHEDDGTEKTKGYVAQDNVDNFPEAYPLQVNPETNESRYMYNPSGMVVYLMKALQEEIAKREALESQYDAILARLDALEG